MSGGSTSRSAPNVHVHVVEELALALPFDRYRNAFPARENTFVLDGAEHAPSHRAATNATDSTVRMSTVSLLGARPFLTYRAWRTDVRRADGGLRARVVITVDGKATESEVDDPLSRLAELLETYAIDPKLATSSPLPLAAGAIGYIGYEVGQILERLPCLTRPSLGMPDIAFGFHDWILGKCHRTNRTWLSVLGRGDVASEARENAERTRDAVVRALLAHETREMGTARRPFDAPLNARSWTSSSSAARTRLTRDAYIAKILEAKRHIGIGDAFEVCLTQPLEATFEHDPWTLWRELRTHNPAPFAAFLDLPEGAIVSSSPERFVRLDASRVVESRPIKGTRPRGATPEEDARLATELAVSPKDRAENAMIVDLVRNDLGRICRFGTVDVPSLYAVENYATVHQMVSTVRGELEDGHTAIDVVRACFPPGSMTGAPKIEAMTIIEGLEETERGVYSGGLGWIDFGGTMDLSVVIRTIVVKDGRAHLHVGGAIIADSDPDAEHEETMHKARALVEALFRATDAPADAPLQSASA